jgi:hypothetical protein
MPIQLPSNKPIPMIKHHHITISVSHHWLFGEHRASPWVDVAASGIRYCELWKEELLTRYPNHGIHASSHASAGGDVTLDYPQIILSDNHPEPRRNMAEVARLGKDLYENRRQEWVVIRGTKLHKRIMDQYAKPQADTGPETSNPA